MERRKLSFEGVFLKNGLGNLKIVVTRSVNGNKIYFSGILLANRNRVKSPAKFKIDDILYTVSYVSGLLPEKPAPEAKVSQVVFFKALKIRLPFEVKSLSLEEQKVLLKCIYVVIESEQLWSTFHEFE